ncbi:hypothetical protein Y032_0004g2142 [Ancylostoma ceylanicum]|nr:hypothetical protein Y032_0004g2142 [Ancylostoma ceylanicum]
MIAWPLGVYAIGMPGRIVQVGAKMDGQLIPVIFSYELLLSPSASKREGYTMMAFGPVFISHAAMNRRFCCLVSEYTSSQRHLPSRRPRKRSNRACSAGVAGSGPRRWGYIVLTTSPEVS